MLKDKIQNRLDTATLGPVGFLSKSLTSSISGAGQALRHPKLLLPTITLSIFWFLFSFFKFNTASLGFVRALGFLTFAQGGMYGGFVGAVGGVFGKAFISYLLTSAMMPLLTGQKKQEAVKMKIGPAFAISGGRGFALFFAGIGMALVLYNLNTGNGSGENMAIAAASILGVFRSMKNPRGFIVEFIRSFSRGRLSRKKAGHFGAGLITGFIISIIMVIMLRITGPIWYALGAVFLILSFFFFILFRGKGGNRRGPARTASAALTLLIFFGQVFMFSGVAIANEKMVSPYEFYNVKYGDFKALEKAIQNKPFRSAELQPIGILLGISYAPLNERPIYISDNEVTSFSLSASSASLEQIYNNADSTYLTSSSVDVSVELYYDSKSQVEGNPYGCLMSILRNEAILPICIKSQAKYNASESFRREYKEDPTSIVTYNISTTPEQYPVIFDYYKDISDSFFADEERKLYGNILDNAANEYDMVIVAKLAEGTSVTMKYWDEDSKTTIQETSDDSGFDDALLFLKVNKVGGSKTASPAPTVTGKWVHKSTEYYVYNAVDNYLNNLAAVERFNGGEYIPGTGISDDGNTLYSKIVDGSDTCADYTVTFGPMPWAFNSEEQIIIHVQPNIKGPSGVLLNQEEPNETVISGGILSQKPRGTVSFGTDHFDLGAFTYKNQQFIGNMPQGTVDGQEVYIERSLGIRSWYPMLISIVDTYAWNVSIAAGSTDSDEEADDKHISDIPGIVDIDDRDFDDWDFDDWNNEAAGSERTVINGAAALAGVIGAGAALAGFGGFGGPGGPGNLRIPGGKYDPSDGTLIIDLPGGSQEIYRLNPETGDFESSYGSTLNPDDLGRYKNDLETDKTLAKSESGKIADGVDGDTGYWNRLSRINRLKDKFEKDATENNDALSRTMANQLQRILDGVNSGRGLDENALKKAMNFQGKMSRGEIQNTNHLPSDYTGWKHFKDGISLTGEEVARGETGLAISLRILSGILTGGQSEMGFEVARSVYKTKDYVDQGMDSWSEITSALVTQTLAGEGFGRAIGAGIKLGGKVIGSIAGKASEIIRKTEIGAKALDKLAGAGKTVSDFFGQDIVKTTKDIFGISSKNASDTAKAMKVSNARLANDAIKKANRDLDDAVRKAGSQVDDLAKTTGKQADDLAKAAGEQADDLAKAAAGPTGKTAREMTPYERATKQWDDAMKNADTRATDEIQRYRAANPGTGGPTNYRDNLFRRGQNIGEQKVANLQRAQERLNAHPGAIDAREAYDHALRTVQQDKFAMNSLKGYNGPGANELRGNFNMRNTQFNRSAMCNTQERLAQERGVNPEDIRFVEATNVPGQAERAIDASRTAEKTAENMYTSPNYRGQRRVDDIVPQQARIDGVPMDQDVTGRIFDRRTREWIDLPKEDVARIYNQELYKIHHGGNLPTTTVSGTSVIDENAISEFAHRMDHTVTDRLSADAFGRGDIDLQNIIDSRCTEIKRFEDVSSITKTMEYKSNEWFQQADVMRDLATELSYDPKNRALVDQLMIRAEASQAEGVRQAVKLFENQVAQQMKAVSAAGQNIKIPEKLSTSISVLDQIGKPDGITMAQAEEILRGMDTSIENVVQQTSSLFETTSRFS